MPKKVSKKTEPKSKPMSTAELFYISERHHIDDVLSIAKALDRTVEEVQLHIPKKGNNLYNQAVGRSTKSGNKNRGITYMTPTASQIAEQTKLPKRFNRTDCIHKMRDSE